MVRRSTGFADERASRAFGYLGKSERNGATSLQDTPPRIERDSFCERGSAPGRARWRYAAHDDTAPFVQLGRSAACVHDELRRLATTRFITLNAGSRGTLITVVRT